MYTNSLGVVVVTAARPQVTGVMADRLADGYGLAVVLFGILRTASEDARPILSLPECEDGGSVRVLEIIGNGKYLSPIGPISIRSTDHP